MENNQSNQANIAVRAMRRADFLKYKEEAESKLQKVWDEREVRGSRSYITVPKKEGGSK